MIYTPPFPITGDGSDASGTLNAMIAQIVANGGGSLFIGPGVYGLKNAIGIGGKNVRVICDPAALFQAQTGFPTPNSPMCAIAPGSTDIMWIGGTFDGNQIGGRGIHVAGNADRITLRDLTVMNVTQYGINGALRTAGLLRIERCTLITGPQPGVYDYTADGNSAILQVRDCSFNGITNIACGSSGPTKNGVAFYEASGNVFTGCGSLSTIGFQPLYGFQCGNIDWHDNIFIGCAGALHVDTCDGGSVCDNSSLNAVFGADFFIEVTPYISIERNIARGNSGERGIVVGVGSNNQGPPNPPFLGISVKSNKVINCKGGIGWGALTQGVFADNYVENPSDGSAFVNENSVGTRFSRNQSVFPEVNTGTHLVVDAPTAPASVYVDTDMSNAANLYSRTNGGIVIIE